MAKPFTFSNQALGMNLELHGLCTNPQGDPGKPGPPGPPGPPVTPGPDDLPKGEKVKRS